MDEPALRILLLENNPGDADLLQEDIRESLQRPVQWICVPTVGQAFERLQLEAYDLILFDLTLPEMQSLETFSKIQKSAHQTPVLVLAERDDHGLALEAVKAGAQDYILKEEMRMNYVARLIHYAIERHRMQGELRSLSLRDGLTGLYNRRGFFMLASEQLKLVRRSSQGLLLFLCDVEGMTSINDAFGSNQGDKALIDTAVILRITFRGSDIIARLGADDFVILAIGTLPATAELLQARLQANINRHRDRSNRPYQLCLNTGISYVPPHGQATVEELIAKADQDLNEQKRARQKARVH